MHSNLITPPDILDSGPHSVLLVDPEQSEVDAVIKFCQHSKQFFNIYVYTPNMDNVDWLNQAAHICDAIVVNTRSDNYQHLCLLPHSYYYGSKIYVENQQKIPDPVFYFAATALHDKYPYE